MMTSHGEGAKSLLELPLEILHAIINEVYSPATKFHNQTALLLANKEIYAEAYPKFLSNSLFQCTPLKAGKIDTDQKKGKGYCDIERIVWPDDNENYHSHMLEPEWMKGLKKGFRTLFDGADEENAILNGNGISGDHAKDEVDSKIESSTEDLAPEEVQKWVAFTAEMDRQRNQQKFSAVENSVNEVHSDNEEEEEEYRDEDFSDTPSFDPEDAYYLYEDATLEERAEEVALWLIRKNAFLRSLKRLGKENAANIGYMEIKWALYDEVRDGEALDVGPYAIAIMSVICDLWLPGLKAVVLKEEDWDLGGYGFKKEEREVGESLEDYELRVYPDYEKVMFMGDPEDEVQNGDNSPMVKAVTQLIEACEGLKELKYENWMETGRVGWWKEIGKREGLKVDVKMNYEETGEAEV